MQILRTIDKGRRAGSFHLIIQDLYARASGEIATQGTIRVMSASQIRTLMASASSAIGGGDWNTAKSKAMQALALMNSMPDSGNSGSQLSWNRDSLEKFIQRCEQQAAAQTRQSNGNSIFGQQKVKFVRPTD